MPASPSSAVLPSPFSMSVSLLLPCTRVHQYRLSRSHTFALICDICFPLSDFIGHDRLLSFFVVISLSSSQNVSRLRAEGFWSFFFFFPSGFVQCSKPSNLDRMTNLWSLETVISLGITIHPLIKFSLIPMPTLRIPCPGRSGRPAVLSPPAVDVLPSWVVSDPALHLVWVHLVGVMTEDLAVYPQPLCPAWI